MDLKGLILAAGVLFSPLSVPDGLDLAIRFAVGGVRWIPATRVAEHLEACMLATMNYII